VGTEAAEDAGIDMNGPDATRPQNTIARFTTDARTKIAFNRLLSSWFISTFTPAQRIEHLDLKNALSLVGITPPSRKELLGAQLDALYRSTKSSVINSLRAHTYVSVTMDGWKKRAAEQGAPLVTVNLLLPDGGSQFWKV
jgi:hypothetical protein